MIAAISDIKKGIFSNQAADAHKVPVDRFDAVHSTKIDNYYKILKDTFDQFGFADHPETIFNIPFLLILISYNHCISNFAPNLMCIHFVTVLVILYYNF